MRRILAALLLVAGAGAAHAQYGAQYGGQYQGQYGAPPYQGGQPGMPSYQDDSSYGTSESYGTDDARADAVPDYRIAPPPGPPPGSVADRYAQQQRDYRAQRGDYDRRFGGDRGNDDRHARAAELRARADACERGDDRACGEQER